MMSNRSSFSIGRYLGYQLKRSNYLFIIFSLIGLLFGPLITYLAITMNLSYGEKLTDALVHNVIFSHMSGVGAFSIYFGAGFLGILFALFFSAYLNGKKATNFYHALPVRRDSWLLSQYLLGFVLFSMINVVIFIGLIGVIAYIGGIGNVPWLILGTHFLQSELFFLCSFALSMLAGQLVGNVLGHLGMIGILQFGVSFFGILLYGLMNTFFKTFSESTLVENLMSFSLPAAYVRYITQLRNLDSNLYTVESKEVLSFSAPYMGHTMIILLAVIALLAILLSFVAYRARRLERASETLVFRSFNFPLKLYLGLLSGLSFGLLLYGISSSTIFLFVGIFCGIVLLHIFYEMGVKRDVRAILKPVNWLSTLIIFLLTATFAASFTTDAFGYDTYKPKEASVLNAGIEVNDALSDEISDNRGNREAVLVEPENINAILALAELGINHIGDRDGHGVMPVAYDTKEAEAVDEEEPYTWFSVSYTLAEGGKAKRQYEVPTKAFYEIYTRVYESKEYRELVKNTYSERLDEGIKAKFFNDYLDEEVFVLLANDKVRFEAFKKAILSDIEKRTIKDLSTKQVANIELEGKGAFYTFNIYESDKASYAFLKKLEDNKLLIPGKSLYLESLPNFSKLVVSGPNKKDDSYGDLKVITDKKEIEDYLKNKTISRDAMHYYRNDTDGRFEVATYLADGKSGKSRVFKANMVPKEFL